MRSDASMKSILVTGGAGFIGSNLVRSLMHRDEEIHVVTLDALTYAGSEENLLDLPRPESHELVVGSVTDMDLVRDLLRTRSIELVIHLAAESHVDRSIGNPGAFIDTNIVGTYCLLESCREVWLSGNDQVVYLWCFHHISIDEVYGLLAPDKTPFSETTAYAPNSPYAASKASSDHLVRAYHETYGLNTTMTNCSNNYGPRQFPEKLIPLIIIHALQGKPLPIYGDGLQIRDWLYVQDHCDAIWKVAQESEPGATYNIGGNSEVTNIALVRTICAILDARFPDSPNYPHASLIKMVTDRPGHDRRYAIDPTRISRDLGWTPVESLDAGLQKTIDWYLENTTWLNAILNTSAFKGWMSQNYEARS